MVIWISIYFIGVFVCGLVQLYTQHLRLVGVDRRRWHHPPERSPYKPIEVWWMFSRGEFAAFLLNCFAVLPPKVLEKNSWIIKWLSVQSLI